MTDKPALSRHRSEKHGKNIRRDFIPFTIRLPITQYAKLIDGAEKGKRSLAAHVELLLEEVL